MRKHFTQCAVALSLKGTSYCPFGWAMVNLFNVTNFMKKVCIVQFSTDTRGKETISSRIYFLRQEILVGQNKKNNIIRITGDDT